MRGPQGTTDRKNCQGENFGRTFSGLSIQSEDPDVDVLALDEALTALSKEDPRLGQIVQLRYFGGFTIEETAEIMEIASATVMRDWTYARNWQVGWFDSMPTFWLREALALRPAVLIS